MKAKEDSKSKKVFKIILKYLKELSVVVAGIAITFAVSNKINTKQNKKTFSVI